MAPGHKTYLDMQYNSTTPLGLHWAGYINVEDAYNWDPATLVESITKNDIVGIEITTMDRNHYQPGRIGIHGFSKDCRPCRDWLDTRQPKKLE